MCAPSRASPKQARARKTVWLEIGPLSVSANWRNCFTPDSELRVSSGSTHVTIHVQPCVCVCVVVCGGVWWGGGVYMYVPLSLSL